MSSLEQHRLRYRKKHLEVTPGVSFDDELKDEPRYHHRRGKKASRRKGKVATATVLESNDSMGESDPISCSSSPSSQYQPSQSAANGNVTHPHGTTEESSSSLPTNNNTATHSAPGTQPVSSDVAPGERDITSSDNAYNDQSSLSNYLDNLGKMHRDALERMYSIAVDAPCSIGSANNNIDHTKPNSSSPKESSSSRTNIFSGVCVEPGALEEPLGYLNCSFHKFALVDHSQHNDKNGDDADSIGSARIGWRKCEYCGCASVTNCESTCQRPKLYFLKQRPPFCLPDGWDPESEYPIHPFGTPKDVPLVIPSCDTSQESTRDNIPEKSEESNHNTSWISGFF